MKSIAVAGLIVGLAVAACLSANVTARADGSPDSAALAAQSRPAQPPAVENRADAPARPFPGRMMGRGVLGAVVANLPDEKGVEVVAVRPMGPGAAAGLERGDVITSIDGKKVTDVEQLRDALAKEKAGSTVKLGIEREGKQKTLEVALGPQHPGPGLVSPPTEKPAPEKPPAETAPPRRGPAGPGFMGAVVASVPEQGGVRVVIVRPMGPAAAAGVERGDVITSIDGKKVTDVEQLEKALAEKKAGSTVKLAVEREGKEQTLEVTLGPRHPGPATKLPPEKPTPKKPAPERPKPAPEKPKPAPEKPKPAPEKPKPEVTEPKAWLGVMVEPSEKAGVLIVAVFPGGPAGKAGVETGDRLLEIGKTKIESPDDVVTAIGKDEPGQKVELVIERGGKRKTIPVTLGDLSKSPFARFGPRGELEGLPPEIRERFPRLTEPGMMLEQQRRMAEQHQRLEKRVEQLLNEVQQLRKQVQELEGKKPEAKKPEAQKPEAKKPEAKKPEAKSKKADPAGL